MYALIWFAVIVLAVLSAVCLLSALLATVRPFRAAWVGTASMGLVILIASFATRIPSVVALAALLGGAIGLAILKRSTRNAAHSGRVTKLSAAHLVLMGGSLLFLIPFVWLISTSLKTDEEQAAFPPIWIPTQQITSATLKNKEGKPAGISNWNRADGSQVRVAEVEELPSGEIRIAALEKGVADKTGKIPDFAVVKRASLTKIRAVSPRWENYSEALEFLPAETHYGLVFLGNTLFLTLMSVIGTVLSSSMVAYSFARLRWPGRETWFVILLATMMIPGAVTMMPQFLIFRSLGWIDTLKPLWVPAFFGSAFNIFLLRQFFLSVPGELEDAAKIDGCGPLGIYWRIMMPLVKPALASVSILSIMGAWNNFQGPLIYLSSPEKMPLAYALQLYQQQHGGEPGLLMAASTLVVLPIIVLFFFTQRYFIEGISLSGLGGR